MWANRIYGGEIRHKRVSHPGQHEAIIERSLWQLVQELLKPRAAHQRGVATRRTTCLLTGKLFDENGEPLYACWSKKGDRRLPLLRFTKTSQRNRQESLQWVAR